MAIQIHLGVYTDPLWLMLLCDRLLDGQTAYLDFLENSPPFAILIYMPPVITARALGVAREPMFVGYVFALSTASLAACGYLLAKTGRLADVGQTGALAALASLLLLPVYTFGQRDHIALILALPWLVAIALRATAEPPSVIASIIVGVLAGMIFAIRPYYVTSFVFVVAYLVWKQGFRALLGCAEVTAAVVSGLITVAASVYFFPYYFTRMLPIVRDLYLPVRETDAVLLLQPPVVAWALLSAALVIWRDRLSASPIATSMAAASCGAFIAYFLQGKGFPYQGYVFVALQFTAFVFVIGPFLAKLDAVIFATVGFLLAWVANVQPGHADLRWPVEMLLVATLCCLSTFSPTVMRIGSRAVGLAGVTGAFVALGSATISFESGWRSPPFLDQVQRLRPHPSVALISNLGEFAHPLISAAGGSWTQSVISLLIANNVVLAFEASPVDPALRERLDRYERLDRDTFLADVWRTRPDVVIVDETWVEWSKFIDAPIRTWLDGYREVAKTAVTVADETRILRLYAR